MLSPGGARARRGVTLIELLVVIVIAGLALGLISAISLREQRVFADLAESAAVSAQLRDAAAILPIDIRGAAVASGDIREARDTSIELRATIASAVVCDTTAAHAIVLAPGADGPATFGSYLLPIQVGDTAWLYTPTDTSDTWRPYRVSITATATAGSCGAFGPSLDASEQTAPRVAIALDGFGTASLAVGSPLRVTRSLRYSLYHASDGNWYLGERDWNVDNLRFNTIQPVSGPFLPASQRGMKLEYFDSTGAVLPVPVADTRRISVVRVGFRGQTRDAARILGAAGAGRRVDSVSVALLLRNRR